MLAYGSILLCYYDIPLYSEWTMVAEHTSCKGTENNEGKMNSIDECANACRKKSSMFVFGTNDFGGNGCDNQGCKCLCETGANADGSCENVQNKGYRLYRISSLGKYES